MKLIFSIVFIALLACSSIAPFSPASCPTNENYPPIPDIIYRDIVRGERDGDCFAFLGEVLQVVDGGYRVREFNSDDIYFKWEGEPNLVEGDTIRVVAMAVGTLTYETVLGAERSIPALHGASVELLY